MFLEDGSNCADEGIQIYGGMDCIKWKVPDSTRRQPKPVDQKAMKGHVDLLTCNKGGWKS
jgi:hypothetical protein